MSLCEKCEYFNLQNFTYDIMNQIEKNKGKQSRFWKKICHVTCKNNVEINKLNTTIATSAGAEMANENLVSEAATILREG